MLWLVLVLCCLILAWWSSRHGNGLEPPSYPGRLPIIGHTHQFWHRKTMFSSLQNMTKYAIEQMRCEPFTVNIGPFKNYWLSLSVCCAVAVWLWTRGRRRARAAPPAYPGALPLIGHALQLLGDETQMWKMIQNTTRYSMENGGVSVLQVGLFTAYVITDPDDCRTVANACLDKPYIYNFGKKWLGNGLITADEITWKQHRKLLNPAFNQKVLNMFVGVFNDQSRELVNQLNEQVGKGFFDPEPYLLPNIMETTCRATLSVNPEANNISFKEYVTATKYLADGLTERMQKYWLHPAFIFNLSSLRKKHDMYCKSIHEVGSEIIQKRKQELHETDAFSTTYDDATDNCKTLLDLLLCIGEKGTLTDSDLIEHLNTFIVSSYETTGFTVLFALVLLGSNQHVQERVYEELQNVLGDTDVDIDTHILSRLVYLDAVLKETMRLYPTIPLVARQSHEDVKLKSYTMPAGCLSSLSIYGVNRHPMWGADAERFRPERWLEPAGVPDHPNAFATFSIGKRNCIGKLYGLMTMKITLVHLLRRYHITADASKLILNWNIVLRPMSGHDISLQLRM